MSISKQAYQATAEEINDDVGAYVSAVFSCLASEFMLMPRGSGFVDYVEFENGYEALKWATQGFTWMESEVVIQAVREKPITAIVLRSILGFTPSEWAYAATEATSVEVSQSFARSFDRNIRLNPERPLSSSVENLRRIRALVSVACQLINHGAPLSTADMLHRLDKADSRGGLQDVRNLSQFGVPYAMLLYERFLGRPFASHRDSVSELVGDVMEIAIEKRLSEAGISFRKTRRAERIVGFDQTPDFIIPSEFNPKIVIEAKITEDDGTARDKVTRVQHLLNLSMRDSVDGRPRFEVIACIGGRGFAVRREDMKKLILATNGKVFTMVNLDHLVDYTNLSLYRTRTLTAESTAIDEATNLT